MFKIGNIEIANEVALAPMAGVSNPSYMKICEEMGAGYAITELISAEAIVRNNKKTLDMLKNIDTLKMPVAVQIFGSNANVLWEAAKIVNNLYPNVFIDINMGCPVPKVAIKSEAGSALMKNPQMVYEIVKTVSESVSVPVTVKIRSGWDKNNINAVEIAKICEKAGAKAIAIHPRTRSQGYSGKADWQIIKAVKDCVSIPVIGNGDIKNCYDAKKMIDETGCDAVMIGRAALGNPWLIKECIEYLKTGKEPIKTNTKEKINMLKKHLYLLKSNKNEKLALLEIRSHASWYLKGIKNNGIIKNEIFKATNTAEIEQILKEVLDDGKY